jgi:hypothetical protein
MKDADLHFTVELATLGGLVTTATGDEGDGRGQQGRAAEKQAGRLAHRQGLHHKKLLWKIRVTAVWGR